MARAPPPGGFSNIFVRLVALEAPLRTNDLGLALRVVSVEAYIGNVASLAARRPRAGCTKAGVRAVCNGTPAMAASTSATVGLVVVATASAASTPWPVAAHVDAAAVRAPAPWSLAVRGLQNKTMCGSLLRTP